MDTTVTFIWDMTQEDLDRLRADSLTGGDDYCGGLFFGLFKVEFIWDDCIRWRVTCLQYGLDNGYAYIGSVPYGQCDEIECSLDLPDAETMKNFVPLVEQKIVALLKKNSDLIPDACKPTDPDIWYEDFKYKPECRIIHNVEVY